MTNDGTYIYLFGGMTDEPSGIIRKSLLSLLANDIWIYTPDKNYWKDEEPVDNTKPEGRYYHNSGISTNNNSLFLFGGYDDNKLLTDIWIFNLASKKWNKVNQQTTLTERMKYGFIPTDNGFFVLGGTNAPDQPIKDTWHYNFSTNTWTKKSDIPFNDTHFYGSAKVSSDKIFLMKKDGADKFYIYNETTDTWREQTTTGTIPNERTGGFCVASGQKIYVGGGYVNYPTMEKDLYELDTQTWIWKKLADMPKELYFMASTAMNNKIYVYGGLDKDGNKSNKFYEYNNAINTWSEKNTIVSVEEGGEIPTEIMLYQNYPNPFNPETIIKFSIPNPQYVILKVYDLLGREITTLVSAYKMPGKYTVKLSSYDLPLSSGIYIYTLRAGELHRIKKMILLK
jgi:N-acetylneuraminic acid mutarotase